MPYDDEPAVWRKRAEEARVQAEQSKEPECRQTMFGIAASYERMAERVERTLTARSRSPISLPERSR